MKIKESQYAGKVPQEIQYSSHSAGRVIRESSPEDPAETATDVEAGPTGEQVDAEKALELPSGTILHLYNENKLSGRAKVVNVNGVPEIYLGHKKDHLWKTRPLRVFEKSLFLQGAIGVPYVVEYGDGRPWILTTQHPSGIKVLARTDGYPMIFKSELGACKKAKELLYLGLKAESIGFGDSINCVAVFEDEDWCSEKWLLLNFSAFHKVLFEESVSAEEKLTAKAHFRKDPKTGKLIFIHDYQDSKRKHPNHEHITFEKGEKVETEKGNGVIIGYDKNKQVLRINLDDGSYISVTPHLVEHLEKKQEAPGQNLPVIEGNPSHEGSEEPVVTSADLAWTAFALGLPVNAELTEKWVTWIKSMENKPVATEKYFASQVTPNMPNSHIQAFAEALFMTEHKEALKGVYGAFKVKIQAQIEAEEA